MGGIFDAVEKSVLSAFNVPLQAIETVAKQYLPAPLATAADKLLSGGLDSAKMMADLKSRGYALDSLSSAVKRSQPWMDALGLDVGALVSTWKTRFQGPALDSLGAAATGGNAQTAQTNYDLASQAAQVLTNKINDAWKTVSAGASVSDYTGALISTVTDAAYGAERAVTNVAAATPDVVKYAAYGLGALAVLHVMGFLTPLLGGRRR